LKLAIWNFVIGQTCCLECGVARDKKPKLTFISPVVAFVPWVPPQGPALVVMPHSEAQPWKLKEKQSGPTGFNHGQGQPQTFMRTAKNEKQDSPK